MAEAVEYLIGGQNEKANTLYQLQRLDGEIRRENVHHDHDS